MIPIFFNIVLILVVLEKMKPNTDEKTGLKTAIDCPAH
jgi:hypothetical protein